MALKSKANRVIVESHGERSNILTNVLHAARVRFPNQKAKRLATNFKRIETMGGPAAAKAELLKQPGREAKIDFLKKFEGIGDKYARNIFMNVCHPEFRQSIAVDSRIQSISEALELEFRSYAAQERFYQVVAQRASLSGWEVDRLIYWYKYEVLTRLGKNETCGPSELHSGSTA